MRHVLVKVTLSLCQNAIFLTDFSWADGFQVIMNFLNEPKSSPFLPPVTSHINGYGAILAQNNTVGCFQRRFHYPDQRWFPISSL